MILLINPPSPFLIDQKVHPPLGILYLATFLKHNGMKVQVIDLAGESETMISSLDTFDQQPELIGITATTPQFGYAKHIAQHIKLRFPKVPIAIGGAHSTIDAASCTMFDYTVTGEGEAAILDYRNWNQQLIQYPHIVDIDTIPYPSRDFIDIEAYRYYVDGEKATTLMTSRGCPYRCAFCCCTWGGKVRFHSPEYVAEEIRYLKHRYGYRAFMFFDDIFVLPRRRLVRMTELLAKENIIYRCFVRSDVADESLLTLLKESGCVEIGFGAESGSQKILNGVCKKSTVADNTQLVELARRVGIRTKAFMVVGLPGESHETMWETYSWLATVAPDSWDVSVYTPYRGSDITRNLSSYDIKIDDRLFEDAWYKGIPGQYKCSVSTKNLSSEDIVQWRDKIERELGEKRYSHPASQEV